MGFNAFTGCKLSSHDVADLSVVVGDVQRQLVELKGPRRERLILRKCTKLRGQRKHCWQKQAQLTSIQRHYSISSSSASGWWRLIHPWRTHAVCSKLRHDTRGFLCVQVLSA